VFRLLEGKNVNLRVMEKKDLPLFAEWVNKPEFFGEYNPLRQTSKTEIEKDFDKSTLEQTGFIIERSDILTRVNFGKRRHYHGFKEFFFGPS